MTALNSPKPGSSTWDQPLTLLTFSGLSTYLSSSGSSEKLGEQLSSPRTLQRTPEKNMLQEPAGPPERHHSFGVLLVARG